MFFCSRVLSILSFLPRPGAGPFAAMADLSYSDSAQKYQRSNVQYFARGMHMPSTDTFVYPSSSLLESPFHVFQTRAPLDVLQRHRSSLLLQDR